MLHANAYVKNNKLYVLGICNTDYGPIPFAHVESCEEKDGPVNFSGEISPGLSNAIDKSQGSIMKQIEHEKMKLTAEELVLASRAGDQVATSHIIMIGENARKGSKRAQYSTKLLKEAIKKFPVTTFGEEIQSTATKNNSVQLKLLRGINTQTDDDTHYATVVITLLPALSRDQGAVILANGPPIDGGRINAIAERLSDDKKSFLDGMENWGNGGGDKNYLLGQQVGLARTIQLVRMPQTPISLLSPITAWELGE